MIDETHAWFTATGQLGTPPNKRWLAFYTGMQLEELSEKLELIEPLKEFAATMKTLSKQLRKEQWDEEVWAAFLANPKLFLDSDVDVIWVTIGAAVAAGADLQSAYSAVNYANWAKKFPDLTFHLDETGKVKKPDGWQEADLSAYVHSSVA